MAAETDKPSFSVIAAASHSVPSPSILIDESFQALGISLVLKRPAQAVDAIARARPVAAQSTSLCLSLLISEPMSFIMLSLKLKLNSKAKCQEM